MSALVRSLRFLRSSQFAVMTLAVVACATAQDPDIDSDGSGNAPAIGGSSSGSGGGGAPAAGKGSTLPVAGTSTLPVAGTTSTGGKPSTGGTGAGGVAPTAGTTTTPTAGTTSTSTCPQYAGTLATDSVIFQGGFGTSTKGTWSGYGYTYKYGTATISPGMGQNCFAGLKFCASGSVPAADSAGAGLGWNISQTQGSATTGKVAISTPVKLTFSGVVADMRVQLSASSTADAFCHIFTAAEVTAKTATIPLTGFKTECWGTTGVAYAGEMIEAIQVVVPGAAAAAKTYDFCLLDIEPG